MASPIEDIKMLRNWVLGVIGFATTVATFLIQVFHFRTEPTIAAVLGFSLLMLLVVFLINRTENRMTIMVKDHIEENNQIFNNFTNRLDSIDENLMEIQKSNVRVELYDEIRFNPENKDTILKIAEKYFGEKDSGGLEGNWYMTNIFLDWAEKQKVKLPPNLMLKK